MSINPESTQQAYAARQICGIIAADPPSLPK
jgi:hypothetical protein